MVCFRANPATEDMEWKLAQSERILISEPRTYVPQGGPVGEKALSLSISQEYHPRFSTMSCALTVVDRPTPMKWALPRPLRYP